jgi:hypothetical protein
VHFEVLVNGRQVDPIRFLAATRDRAASGESAHTEDR